MLTPGAVRPDLSVLLLAIDEERNLATLLPEISRVVRGIGLASETIVVDGGSRDDTVGVAARCGARVIRQARPGYGEALQTGFAAALGSYVLTMDADLSHEAGVIGRLWAARDPRGIAIASRYVPGGSARTGLVRLLLSRLLNAVFSRGLSLGVRDVSSGFRLYPVAAIAKLSAHATDFDILPEILVRAHAEGWRITEIPFQYSPRQSGSSKARVLRLGIAYVRTFARLLRLRHSPAAASGEGR